MSSGRRKDRISFTDNATKRVEMSRTLKEEFKSRRWILKFGEIVSIKHSVNKSNI